MRISGPQTLEYLARCLIPDDATAWPPPRAARVCGHLETGPPLGRLPCDVYVWPGTRSYTRQPTAEIHTLGSPPLLDAVQRTLCAAGARLAEPGEFTMRAFLAGRIDLPQAEAVLGVIDAANQHQLQTALSQLAGGLSGPLHALRDILLNLVADLEAGLDFVDEDIQFIAPDQAIQQLQIARQQIDQLLEQMQRRGQAAFAARVVLHGAPNVGKSTLWNALLQQSRAIVSDIPGTTRDYLTESLILDGWYCTLIDTAGIDPQLPQAIDAAAQSVTAQAGEMADLMILCLDGTRPLNAWEQRELLRHQDADPPRLLVVTKLDQGELPATVEQPVRRLLPDATLLGTSGQTGFGLDALRQAIVQQLEARQSMETSVVGATAVRCHSSLRLAGDSLERAERLVRQQRGDELVSSEIRVALDELGKVVGAVYTDDILDRVFSRFCIGK